MGKFFVLLCFALLSMTLVMACSPLGAICARDEDCCSQMCISMNPWFPQFTRCKPFKWGQQGQGEQGGQWGQWGQGGPWGQWGQGGPWGQWRQGGPWGQGGPEESGDSGSRVDLPVKEPTQQ